jgi:hypothetical protein
MSAYYGVSCMYSNYMRRTMNFSDISAYSRKPAFKLDKQVQFKPKIKTRTD